MIEIKPTYVSFAQAQLLKEKGFKSKSRYYDGNGDLVESPNIPENDYRYTNNMMQRFRYEAPEQWAVVEFLRIKYNIWIEVHHIKTTDNKFYTVIWKYGEQDYHTLHCENLIGYQVWGTPQETYSAAIDYVLTNLI
jgi:hypothetical protein